MRRHELDRLKVLLMGAVFFFHNARYFDTTGWHVKNPATAEFFTFIVDVMVPWMMPLFMVLSAAAIRYALDNRSPGAFLKARVVRLLVPLAFGVFFLSPQQVWIERTTANGFTGNLIDFLPRYFDGLYGLTEGGNFAFHGLHLWYLMVLFLISLVLLPLFLWFRGDTGRRFVNSIAGVLARPWGLVMAGLAIAVPFALIPDDSIMGMKPFGGWSLSTYLVWAILGYLVFADERLVKAVTERRRLTCLIGVVLLTAVMLGLALIPRDSLTTGLLVTGGLLYGLAAWNLVAALLGVALARLNGNRPLRPALAEGVMPFYMWHQMVIVVMGYLVLDWSISPAVKFPAMILITLPITAALTALVTRVRFLRPLFGLRSRPRTS